MRFPTTHRAALWATAVLTLACAFSGAHAQTTVWADDCAGTGTGTQGDPFCQIQAAICSIKTTGGTIRVLPGIYHEAIRVTANIAIVSTDGPAVTTLDATGRPCVVNDFCTYQSTTNCSAVYFPSAASNTSRIEGIRITGGGGIDNSCGSNCTDKIGGGITVYGSSPTITRNEIVGNVISSASTKLFYGGGIYINSLPVQPAPRPVITNNLIQGNAADPPAGQSSSKMSEGDGGGIYVGYNTAPIISGNAILSNRAGNPATINQFGGGGGIAIYTTNALTGPVTQVTGNLISDNNAADFGAGIGLGQFDKTTPVSASRATIENNVFDINGGVDGGAIGASTTRATVRNNTIHNNNAAGHGGGVFFGPSANATDQVEFVNNLVTSNQATGAAIGGGLYVDLLANPTVRYNDLHGNTPINVGGNRQDADYIGVSGGVSVDPLYVAANGTPPDYHLLPQSPVIEAGENAGVLTTTDFDGAPRIADADYNGTATIDLGAFEFQPDFDGDGMRDWQDEDDDDDGVPDVSDCAPLAKAISQAPAMVDNGLRVGKPGGIATINWSHAFQAPAYNVYRGTFGGGQPFAYDETCFDTENVARSIGDGAVPSPGTGFYYIVGSRNACGESPAVTSGQNVDHTPSPTCTTANRNSDADTPRDLGDNCPSASNATQGDVDADSQGDACDNCPSFPNVDQSDGDADGRGTACDNCPSVPNPTQDDLDQDGPGDACDNCVSAANPGQEDNEHDGLGDVCDPDDDNDGVADPSDNCTLVANPSQADNDGDLSGDDCDPDDDNDGVADASDNCALVANPSQADNDGDLSGDDCDPDDDNDGVADTGDNCALVANPSQADNDGDLSGDDCDPDDDNDGVVDGSDCATFDPGTWAVPLEVGGLTLAKGATTTLDWPAASGGTGGLYDVIGGSIASLAAEGGVGAAGCLESDFGSTTWSDVRPDPPADTGEYYLVRAQNTCGVGTYGSATAGGERVPPAACP